MKLQFLGATQTVTGSRYLVTSDHCRLLVDCGLFQGPKELRRRNWTPFPIDPKSLNAIILTHAHLDHTGALPLLIKDGYDKSVYCSPPTKDLCGILFPDSGHLQEEEARLANKYGYSKHKVAMPLYTEADGRRALAHLKAVPFDHNQKVSPHLCFRLNRVGHILGAACALIQCHKTSILFSGDLGRSTTDVIMNPPKIMDGADYLVVESTYGNRKHHKESHLDQLCDIVNRTVKRGGSVIIPAFAVDRSQHIIYDLYQLKMANRIPDVPVFLDSPMAINATKLFKKYHADHALSSELAEKVFSSVTYTTTPKESKKLAHYEVPRIIISASGMATGGRILHHLKIYAKSYRNTIIFTGYQASGTRGDRMVKGEKEIKIHGQMIPVKAEIEMLTNMSAHADFTETLKWMSHFTNHPKRVFITHGNPESTVALKNKIEEKFGWPCTIPEYEQEEILT